MQSYNPDHTARHGRPTRSPDDRERRLELLIRRLPGRLQAAVRWLRQPAKRWARIPAGFLLIIGGLLSILPIFGLWMLPLGLVFLSDDIPPLRYLTGRMLGWVEHHRPGWMGLPHAPQPPTSCPKETS